MIAYNPKSWFAQIFFFHRSDTLRILWQEMVLIGVYAGGLTWLLTTYFPDNTHLRDTLSVHSLIGFVMGLFLVFRTNTAYDRWWEGRKLWGALVNVSRNFSIKIHRVLPSDAPEKHQISDLLAYFPYVVKEHLRLQPGEKIKHDATTDPFLLSELSDWDHEPSAVTNAISKRIHRLYKEGKISGEELIILDKESTQLLDILGGCERIRSTPIPYSYSMFIKKFIFLYCITLPIGLVLDFQYWSIPVTMFVFYVMVSLEVLAEEIEDPFGNDDNDLPTDDISKKILGNISEIKSKN
jgi:ion channel-forming bestrophin family protein